MIKFSNTNYYGNETGLACMIGHIFQRTRHDFIFLTNIFDEIPELDRSKCILKSNPKTFILSSETGVSIDFNARYSVPLRESEVRLRFKNKHSAFVYLTASTTYSLAIEKIREHLYSFWKKKGYIEDVTNYCLINTLLEAEAGKILFAKCNNTSVTLGHSEGKPVTSLEGLIDAKVGITRDASSVGIIDTNHINQPVVQMVRWYKKYKRMKFRFV